MGNRFGRFFHVTTFGESHGTALGCVVDGCPARIPLTRGMIQSFLDKRKPGQNPLTSPRQEKDQCQILSGVENGLTLGTPIAILIPNEDKNPSHYQELESLYRPSHADYTTQMKYGISPSSGGGRASARETVGRVAAAAVAKAYVQSLFPELDVVAFVQRVHEVSCQIDLQTVSEKDVEQSPVRCPDLLASTKMQDAISEAKNKGNSLGGVITCVIKNPPVGLGEPVFDKMEALLAQAMLSLPASKSFEIGSGLSGTYLTGLEHNDPFYLTEQNQVQTKTNHSGGIQGGISNGMPIYFSVGFKPVSTLFMQQTTLSKNLEPVTFSPREGRHDPCVLPRAVPLVEGMSWLVLAELILRQSTKHSL